MKKIIKITLILLLVSTTGYCQISESNWLVGGGGNYTHTKTNRDSEKSYSNSTATLDADIGYFIRDKWAIGGLVTYRKYESSKLFGMGVFTRYYFLKTKKKINIFSQAHCTYAVNKVAETFHPFSYGLKFGQVTFLNNCVGLELTVEIEKTDYEAGNYTIFKTGIGLQIHL